MCIGWLAMPELCYITRGCHHTPLDDLAVTQEVRSARRCGARDVVL
jgi:hypothetical protein